MENNSIVSEAVAEDLEVNLNKGSPFASLIAVYGNEGLEMTDVRCVIILAAQASTVALKALDLLDELVGVIKKDFSHIDTDELKFQTDYFQSYAGESGDCRGHIHCTVNSKDSDKVFNFFLELKLNAEGKIIDSDLPQFHLPKAGEECS